VNRDWPNQETGLYVSWSSITSAMHFAAYLGAKNIILVGHDCGEIDGQSWVKDYGYETGNPSEMAEAKQRNYAFENQSIAVKQRLKELYKCNIYSLNPFINYNLEGVTLPRQEQYQLNMKNNSIFWENTNIATEDEFNDFLQTFTNEQLVSSNKAERENKLDPPEFSDLYFLYKTTRESHAVSILEFGSGYSTLIFAIALYQNYLQFGQDYLKKCTHPNAFELLTIDASPYFLKTSIERIPEEIQKFVIPHSSKVELFEFGGAGGQIANRWIDLPNFSPDLIYIDGPDPEQITTED
jgi:hypothetical protein